MPPRSLCRVYRLGSVDYQQAWDLQVHLARDVQRGSQPNTLLLLEHPSTFTKGRLSLPEHILLGLDQSQAKGIPVYETDRGGQVTYHGPGQLVAYPVVDLRHWGGPLKYVRTLEKIIAATLADFDIDSNTLEGLTGVWTASAKIAAIGVKISRGVAYHGFSVNVNTDLSYYDYIVPCGIEDRPVTSMAQLLGRSMDVAAVQYSLVYRFGQGMGFKMQEAQEIIALSEVSPL